MALIGLMAQLWTNLLHTTPTTLSDTVVGNPAELKSFAIWPHLSLVLPAYNELAAQLPAEPVLHIDESPTKEGQSKAWIWTFVAASFTLFACRTSRAGSRMGSRRARGGSRSVPEGVVRDR